eukprot:1146310-Pelagomonas_calceolata.AAC.1
MRARERAKILLSRNSFGKFGNEKLSRGHPNLPAPPVPGPNGQAGQDKEANLPKCTPQGVISIKYAGSAGLKCSVNTN